MPLIDTPMLRALGRFLDVNAFRETLVASNMANIDTPGYRTRDVNFQAELARAAGWESSGGDAAPPVARTLDGLVARPDGNNVSAEREGLLLAETQLRFHLGTELVRAQFRQLATAINEGK